MSAKPATPSRQRPLSPFMIGPYYRPQLTSMLSITHRATGVGNAIGAIGLVVWLLCIAAGPEALACFNGHAGAWYGQALLVAWTWSVSYHLCNGLRHLMWDSGRGFDLRSVYRTGYLVIAGSLILTALVWAAVLA